MKNDLDLTQLHSLYQAAKRKNKTIKQLTDFLRGSQFHFLENEPLLKACPDIQIEEKHSHYYRFMVLYYKEAYDSRLAFAFKLMGVRKGDVQVYVNNRYFETWHISIGHSSHNFRKPKQFFFFPAHMSYEDRSKWRNEYKKAEKTPGHEFSKFFKKWEASVKLDWSAKKK